MSIIPSSHDNVSETQPRTWRDLVAEIETQLESASTDLASSLRANPTLIKPSTQVRIRQHAIDCVAASAILRSEHEAATRTAKAHAAEHNPPNSRVVLRVKMGDAGTPEPGADGLAVAFKSVFFPIRAYQDDLYGLLLLALTGHRAGDPSMNSAAAKPTTNPVGVFLTERMPDYLAWFRRWRDQRNDIKDGANFGILGPDDDLGLVFARVGIPGSVDMSFDADNVIKLGHIALALDFSARLTRLCLASDLPATHD